MSKSTSILIAFPVDPASLILGKFSSFDDYPNFYCKIWLVDKLRSDKEIKITLYVDEQLKTKFMNQMLQDVQTLEGDKIAATSSQVRKAFIIIKLMYFCPLYGLGPCYRVFRNYIFFY